jgi:hypothetical protein
MTLSEPNAIALLAPDIAHLFVQAEGRLPAFRGEGLNYEKAWRAASGVERRGQWLKAAIASRLERAAGQCGDGPTQLQKFARCVGIGPNYVSRLATTHRAFDRPDDPGITRLLADGWFSFKHFLIAATCAPDPTAALVEARHHKWSANELARVLASRRHALPIEPQADPTHDDDDVHVERLPARLTQASLPRGMREVRFLMTKAQYKEFEQHVRELGRAIGATTDLQVVLFAVGFTHARRETIREQLDASTRAAAKKEGAAA